MAHLFNAQYQQQQQQHHQLTDHLFDNHIFIETLDLILKNDQHFHDVTEQQTAVLNIVAKIADWMIRNNIPNDGTFLMCTWTILNSTGYDMTVLKFNRTELIRLMSHSQFGYPNIINEHQNVCTCKRRPIDWSDVSLLFTSFDYITNG